MSFLSLRESRFGLLHVLVALTIGCGLGLLFSTFLSSSLPRTSLRTSSPVPNEIRDFQKSSVSSKSNPLEWTAMEESIRKAEKKIEDIHRSIETIAQRSDCVRSSESQTPKELPLPQPSLSSISFSYPVVVTECHPDFNGQPVSFAFSVPTFHQTMSIPEMLRRTKGTVFYKQQPNTSKHSLVCTAKWHHDIAAEFRQYDSLPLDDRSRWIFIDIGANFGLVTLPVAAKGYRTISFEPVPRNVQKIRESVYFNQFPSSRVTVEHAAVSDQDGDVEIFVPDGQEDNASLNRVAAHANAPGYSGSNPPSSKVRKFALDSYLKNSNISGDQIVFVKIDVQGHEFAVLQGMRQLLMDHRPVVSVEYDRGLLSRQKIHGPDMLKFVHDLGFSISCKGKSFEPSAFSSVGCDDDLIFRKR